MMDYKTFIFVIWVRIKVIDMDFSYCKPRLAVKLRAKVSVFEPIGEIYFNTHHLTGKCGNCISVSAEISQTRQRVSTRW